MFKLFFASEEMMKDSESLEYMFDFILIVDDLSDARKNFTRELKRLRRQGEMIDFGDDSLWESDNLADLGAKMEEILALSKEESKDLKDSLFRCLVICDIEYRQDKAEEDVRGLDFLENAMRNPALQRWSFLMTSSAPTIAKISRAGELDTIVLVKGEMSQATFEKSLKRTIKKRKGNSLAFRIGQLINEGRFSEALEQMNAFSEKKKGPIWLIRTGRCYLGLDRLDEAEIVFLALAENQHTELLAHTYLVELYKKKGDVRSAIVSLEKLKELNPSDIERKLQLSEYLVAVEEYIRAKQVLDETGILEESKQLRVIDLLKQSGFVEEAEKKYERLLSSTETLDSLKRIAAAMRSSEEYERAEETYVKMMRLHQIEMNRDHLAWYNRALNCLYRMRAPSVAVARKKEFRKRAEEYLLKAAEISPEFKEAIELLDKLQSKK